MKQDIIVVGEEEEIAGYRLAGVSKTYTPNARDLMEKLSDGSSIILITSKAKKALKKQLEGITKKSIIQEIPEWDKPYTAVEDIIRDTVGFDLRK